MAAAIGTGVCQGRGCTSSATYHHYHIALPLESTFPPPSMRTPTIRSASVQLVTLAARCASATSWLSVFYGTSMVESAGFSPRSEGHIAEEGDMAIIVDGLAGGEWKFGVPGLVYERGSDAQGTLLTMLESGITIPLPASRCSPKSIRFRTPLARHIWSLEVFAMFLAPSLLDMRYKRENNSFTAISASRLLLPKRVYRSRREDALWPEISQMRTTPRHPRHPRIYPNHKPIYTPNTCEMPLPKDCTKDHPLV